MTRRGDEFHAEAFDIINSIVECVEFQFASVAGAGIDLANGNRAAEQSASLRFDLGAEFRKAPDLPMTEPQLSRGA